MKKFVSLMVVLTVALVGLSACGSGEKTKGASKKEENTLIVYSPNSEDIVNTLIPMFEKETGIKVELVSAGTGELLKRISSEKENPYADVMFGGLNKSKLTNEDLFEKYTSKNDKDMIEGHQNIAGVLTPYITDGSNILINTDLIGDIKIEGYEDLLNAQLKGKIAAADPASSSSGFAQLTNMLLAMGGDYESDKGWDYVGSLIKNLDGKVANGSGAVHKGVADGEFVVGLTYEDPSASYIRDGAPVKIVYPKEGAVYLDAALAIIKDAKHKENAEKFIDFMTSKEAQDIFGEELTNRPLRKDAALGNHMVPMKDIKILTEDEDYVQKNKDKIVNQYTDLFTELQ
ncbi:iron ABC transporter substrate-binding protein [Carnobacterium maltaromaticum]|uniref:extracellular solute-binding protein n=1 Tax=Carnobacterium TaxID=2747 RepID=UPI0007049347|nr:MULTISPECIES: extracellular solute-binding protein [Carnobacterium]KRN85736.1 Fe3+ ABC superfamily ATP binding cassette transporter, binding protein [Carnobacterium maltaromaticum]MBQ6485208.1 extracellular solute-binding protein [Carnobacterium sp.]MCC4313638.1 iron ABC transporter substrate-binding protein [Carnobacterium maltaromaticum]MDT1946392.1 extracellular solute-binding protein [Carnobacterium maltaromaticum]MDT2000760.1 extracellular solute-binding protein [Carnobacterium maltaro